MVHKLYSDADNKYRYFDKNGNEILSGMILRHDDGEEEKVYDCSDQCGTANLGFLASSPTFLERHPEWAAEYYTLSQFNLSEWEIVKEG